MFISLSDSLSTLAFPPACASHNYRSKLRATCRSSNDLGRGNPCNIYEAPYNDDAESEIIIFENFLASVRARNNNQTSAMSQHDDATCLLSEEHYYNKRMEAANLIIIVPRA